MRSLPRLSRSRWPSALLSLAVVLTAALVTGAAAGIESAVNAPAAPAPQTTPYWVFFKDRGAERLDSSELVTLAQKISPAAWEHRARGRGAAMPDLRDEPVWEPYVRQIASFGHVRYRSRWLNAVSVDVTREALAKITRLPCVVRVQPVARGDISSLGPALSPSGQRLNVTQAPRAETPTGIYPYGPSFGQLEEIGVPEVQAMGFTGNRVRLMMIDTGFRKDHHAFRHAKILAEWDFVFHDGDTQNQDGDYWWQHYHGTGTWATLGGYDPGHIIGPAYGATFVLAKTEDVRSETRVEEDNYVAALEWADSLGVTVTSASLGYLCFDDGFCYNYPMKDGHTPVISEAIEIAAGRGICCVNAMGNYGPGPGSIVTPPDADSVVAVGAVDSLDLIADFSSRGPSDDGRTKPEVCARGVETWWADASGVDTYGYASGTSLSTPLVGGSCALLLEAHPEWGPMDVRRALMETADRHNTPGNDYGWGRVDLPAALQFTPIVFPLPFSLVSPADSSTVPTVAPTFTWRSTRTPTQMQSPQYTLWIWDPSPGGEQFSVPAGRDTVLALPFALQASTVYNWEVKAENALGHRRTSRETFTLTTPSSAGVPSAAGAAIAQLTTGPNPFRDRIEIRARMNAALGADAKTEWSVYDPLGRKVAGDEGRSRGGEFTAAWNGRDLSGRPAAAGIYYLEVRCGRELMRRPLVHLAAGR